MNQSKPKPQKKISIKVIAALLSVCFGLALAGVIGMAYFDKDYTEDQKLTIAIQDKYPTQESLEVALKNGEITVGELSNELQAYMYFQGTEFDDEFSIDWSNPNNPGELFDNGTITVSDGGFTVIKDSGNYTDYNDSGLIP